MEKILEANLVLAPYNLISMDADDFLKLLEQIEKPLIIMAQGKHFFQQNYQYMVSFKGFNFQTKSLEKLPMPAYSLIVESKQSWAAY
jgi:hypothetical protein